MTDAIILEGKITECAKVLQEHDEWLNGNGKPGAKTILALIQADMVRIQGRLNGIMAVGASLLVAVLIDLVLRVIGKVY